MSGRTHPDGFCTCKSHADRQWDRSEHWTAADVDYLMVRFGSFTDATIARHLGRTVVGVRIKAKRLGLHKRDVGMSSRDVAAIFDIDETTVSKVWIRRGLLRARRARFAFGPNRMWVIADADVRTFIREQGHYFDVDRMPESVYRDLAAALPRWHNLPDAQRLTGRHSHILSLELSRGRWHGRKRGTRWYVDDSTVEAIRSTARPNGRVASMERRQRTLEHRRNVRKGIETRRPHPLVGVRSRPVWWRVVPCQPCERCEDKGRILRNGSLVQPLPETWAA